jgi:hypothetical protein
LEKDADQAIALAIISGTWQGDQLVRQAHIAALFVGVLNIGVATTKLAEIPVMAPAEHQKLVNERFTYVQSALEAFLVRTQKETLVVQRVSEALQLDVPSTSALLNRVSPQVGRGPLLRGFTLLRNINDPKILDRLQDGTYKFPLDEVNFPACFKCLRLLHKDALVITKLQIKTTELAWWLDGNHAEDMGWLHPMNLPIDTTSQADIGQWIALEQFFVWKGRLPTADLTAFEFATTVLDSATNSTAVIAALAQLTTWDATDIHSLAVAFHWFDSTASFDVVKQELRKASNLVHLADCMQALRRLGVNAARAITWAKAEPGSTQADALKQTVKAKYDLTQWQEVMRPLQDEFREQKRQALVAWLVAHPKQAAGQNWSDTNGLYSHFLIDVEMCACMLTSRLKQAAASAQLFVQRCLLSLEEDLVANTDFDPKWKQWKWMKQYRVWEANRKVFLYPENWIEPELRDEKSPFFKELETELGQNDVTRDTAEQAFLNYLEKLDKVANLEIRAMHEQAIINGEPLLHVFARSRSSQAPEYYYRKRINRGRWVPWEKVELDINANHLVAGVHNGRLHLFWPQFLPKASENTTSQQPEKYWDVRLYWSELKKDKWTPKVLSDSFTRVRQSSVGGEKPENVQFRVSLFPLIKVLPYVSPNPEVSAPANFRAFTKIGKQIVHASQDQFLAITSPPGASFQHSLIRTQGSPPAAWYYFGYGTVSTPKEDTGWANSQLQLLEYIPLLKKVGETFTVIDSAATALAERGSFFMWDQNRAYFSEYSQHMEWFYSASTSRAGWNSRRVSSFRFFIHYHPFVELFVKELNITGVKGLLNRRIQVEPQGIQDSPPSFNFLDYQPDPSTVSKPLPVEDVDFSYLGAYASYNWELFFHIPIFIANKLSANQRFEEALEWFHYIFDPTSIDNAVANPDTPQQKYWITKPFYETTKTDYYKQKIESIMLAIAEGDSALLGQVDEWRNNPFNPHLIARMRTVAYQKNLLIKYIQTLVAWGDQLFRRETIETMNEATQLYILAASVLGPRPKSIPKKAAIPANTFYQFQQVEIDGFGNILEEVENLFLTVPYSGTPNFEKPELPRLNAFYFCIPNNEKLLTLWDSVADRLFKIRHCMNIEGVVRQLPLFEPPIDPAMLVQAAAAGLDIGTALSEMNAPLPVYRFNFMIQRALEVCTEVKSLGAAMLAALEKRDSEAFSLLRSSHERVMLEQVRAIKNSQIEEALRNKESLEESRRVIEARRDYYQQQINNGWNGWEIAGLLLTGLAIPFEASGVALDTTGAALALVPEFDIGMTGIHPTAKIKSGGGNLANAISGASSAAKGLASILQTSAGMTATIGNYRRREEDWHFQKQLAEKELPPNNRQIIAADIRHRIAVQDLANQEKQIENAQKEDEYLRTKFTSRELYDWMISQLSTVYFQSYQLAYDLAKRAERCFRYELGLSDSSYIQFGYWDSLKKGLLSGEKLHFDLKRLETAYYEQNRREHELAKHISLAQLDPFALLQLRLNGECFVDIPEAVFDMDYPGHYFRRIKSVSLSIPCVTGPYTTVACTLTLTSNRLRKDSALRADKYARDFSDISISDPRFRDEISAIQSIATSNAQADDGMFELNFRDERYLPFESAGAVSSWHIKLNKDLPQFDFSTIADLIIHLNYTAREGGEELRAKVVAELNAEMNELALAENRKGLFRVFDLKREFPDKWYKFLHPTSSTDDQEMVLEGLEDRLPYFTRKFPIKEIQRLEIVAQMKEPDIDYIVALSALSNLPQLTYSDLLGAHHYSVDLMPKIAFDNWTVKLRIDDDDTTLDFKSLPADAIGELFLIVNYSIGQNVET